MQILQGILYKLTGAIFLQYLGGTLANLSNLGRFTEGTDIVTFASVLVSISPFLFKRKWEVMDISLMILGIAYHAIFAQGRMYLVISVGAIVISTMFQLGNSRYFSIFKYAFYFVGALLLVVVVQKMNFFSSGERALSLSMRQLSFEYYWNKIFSNVTFGIGFPNPITYKNLLKGTPGIDTAGGYYNPADVGVVGTAGILGVSAMVFFIWVLLIMIKTYSKMKDAQKKALLIVMFYIGLSLTTLSPLDMQRVFLLVLTLATADFIYNQKEEVSV